MAVGLFYMRVRGKVTGPFDVATLQKLVRRGTLSRIHEISGDRSAWSAAGEFEDLFPTIAPPLSNVAVAEAPRETEEAASPGNGNAATHILYYYTQRGSTVGPVPLLILKTLVENGTIRRDDLVWRENSDTGAPAAQMPALAPLFGGDRRGRAIGYQSASSSNPEMDAAVVAVARQANWVGIAGGAGILVLMNLPWFIVGKKLVCWWDLFRTTESTIWGYFATVLVLAAITLCVVAPLVTGLGRSIVYLSLMVATLIFLCAAMINSDASFEDTMSLTVPIAFSLLAGICAFRNHAPGSIGGRVLLGICSGIVTLGMVLGLLKTIQNKPDLSDLQAGVIIGAVLAFIGFLAGLASGIMGFVGLKPRFSPALNSATAITSYAALLLPGLGIFIAVLAVSQPYVPGFFGGNGTNEIHWVVVEILTRVIVIFYACTAILSVGINELLTSAQTVGRD